MSESSDNLLDTPALDTANMSSNSITPPKDSPKASTIELIQTLQGKVASALEAIDREDAEFNARLNQLSDRIESFKRSNLQ